MSLSFRRILLATSLLGTIACAHNKAEDKPPSDPISQEVQEQPSRSMHGEVAHKGFEAIQNSKSLTESEKEKLLEIHNRMRKETFAIQDETSRLKGVLFETITTRPYNAQKVNEIKKRLVELNDKKMKNMFNAVDEVEKIVNKKTDQEMKDIYRSFLVDHPPAPSHPSAM